MFKRCRVQQGKHTPKRVMRGNPVWQRQKALQPLLAGAVKRRYIFPVVRLTDHSEQPDHNNIQKFVPFNFASAWV
jgi:hypothetical protein